MNIKISTETFRIISIFERVTKVHPKDCIVTDDCIYFLVDKEFMPVAIGKSGSNIKEARKHLIKNIKVLEYSEDPQTFIKNMIPAAQHIEIKDGSIEISVPAQDKSATIGKGGRNIKAIREILKRHLKVENVRLK